MDPLVLYLLIAGAAAQLLGAAASLAGTDTRDCPQRGETAPLGARRCRHCGYQPT